ncbi:MAG TPA: PD-(D/E)XK nuclease family protein [Terracidiphilus sp.]|nr:PD-(D/E)XK nuclease family protein [Terracidiphilus sp.]
MCPAFGIDTVRSRPDNDLADETTVRPGLHAFGGGSTEYGVVWWDPNAFELGKAPSFSIRQRELLEKGNDEFVQKCLTDYEAWQSARSELLTAGSTPTIQFETATAGSRSILPFSVDVKVIELEKENRPYGPRFGTLVHSILAAVSLNAAEGEVAATAVLQGRILGAPSEEVNAAILVVNRALREPLIQRARNSDKAGQCFRELPLTLTENGLLIEGVADLVFKEDAWWVVVDFKTDAGIKGELERYRKQVSIYAKALSDIHGGSATSTY